MTALVVTALIVASLTLWPAAWIKSLHAVFIQLGGGPLTLLMILLVPSVADPYIYLMRSLQPLLAQAPRTNERISSSDQLAKIAAVISGRALAVALVAAVGMVIGGMLFSLGAFLSGESVRGLVHAAPLLVMGGLLSRYLLHIGRLKGKLVRAAA